MEGIKIYNLEWGSPPIVERGSNSKNVIPWASRSFPCPWLLDDLSDQVFELNKPICISFQCTWQEANAEADSLVKDNVVAGNIIRTILNFFNQWVYFCFLFDTVPH
ncbi:hypothetical protein AMTRI_Chr03g45000 [Amborella trichopoda]